ncbi:peptidoglycan-binding protein [Kitasatospora purpeofusca]|uniref:peptidoglycan-binding protein n=1 Tax=Kitasatospora purpeofusca TaxID=67352 RepID=UPI0036D329CC
MGRRLLEEGCGAYRQGPGPQWSEADRRSYARWQRKLGYAGADVDGWPGASSLGPPARPAVLTPGHRGPNRGPPPAPRAAGSAARCGLSPPAGARASAPCRRPSWPAAP